MKLVDWVLLESGRTQRPEAEWLPEEKKRKIFAFRYCYIAWAGRQIETEVE